MNDLHEELNMIEKELNDIEKDLNHLILSDKVDDLEEVFQKLEIKDKKTCNKCKNLFIPKNGNRDNCYDCNPSKKCPHGKMKGRCKMDGCYGKEICEHKEHYLKCSICNPGVKELDKLNRILRNILNNKKIQEKTEKFASEMLGLENFVEIKEMIKKKFEICEKEFGKIDNYQIDHIKPKSKFDLKKKEEFMKCSHYSNLQILPKSTNLKKINAWTPENEIFWLENISMKKYESIYM
tara:strand:- start:26077 stop:26787 length:711 start_codon:yes stop_codon:yes gene_type:complete